MTYRDNVEVYIKKKIKDGYGGYEDKDIFVKNIECRLSNMTTQKQSIYFGNISNTALTLMTNDEVNYNNFIKIDGELYDIIRINKVFNRYVIDIEVKGV